MGLGASLQMTPADLTLPLALLLLPLACHTPLLLDASTCKFIAV
jgi:hypothetical protein